MRTRRKRTEHALRESEERLRMALNASSQGWFDIDLRSGKVDVSPEYVRMIGYDPDNFDNDIDNWLGHVHPKIDSSGDPRSLRSRRWAAYCRISPSDANR